MSEFVRNNAANLVKNVDRAATAITKKLNQLQQIIADPYTGGKTMRRWRGSGGVRAIGLRVRELDVGRATGDGKTKRLQV